MWVVRSPQVGHVGDLTSGGLLVSRSEERPCLVYSCCCYYWYCLVVISVANVIACLNSAYGNNNYLIK